MIAVISGSNRKENNSLKLARHVVQLYQEMDEAATLLDLNQLPEGSLHPQGYGNKPEALQTGFIEPVLSSEGLHIVVPEYNGSFPGVLKYFIDLLPFPESFDCRPVAFIGHSGGYYGALRSVEQLQMVFAYRNAYLFNRRVFIPAAYKVFAEDGSILDEDLVARLATQAEKFIGFTRSLKADRS